MGVAKPVKLQSMEFRTQGETREFFSAMLKRYKVGAELNDEDSALLGQLLRRHRCYDEIVGCGIDSFTTTIAEEGTKCFAVLRDDGTVCGFSYNKCITRAE